MESDVAASHKRVAPVWACFLPDIGADWGIENIATRPEHRRRGLASVLLDEVLREGSQRGCKLAQITTFIGNHDSESVYKKAGFKVSDEKRCSEMASVLNAPGFVRFTREL
jgi:GNAT superfamily N-acetyltransferase